MTAALFLIGRWAVRQFIDIGSGRMVNRLLSEKGRTRCATLTPESEFVVELTEDTIICRRPDGLVEKVKWSELERIRLMDTGDAPFSPAVFWLLEGSTGGCCIPSGAVGEAEMLSRLQTLPGYNSQVILQNRERPNIVECWRKPTEGYG